VSRRLRHPNDSGQYDDLTDQWWRPNGALAMLHWLARARARLVPPASRPDAVLIDVGCGGGLLAPHLAGKGYRHVGVDLVSSALTLASAHGVRVVRGDATFLPFADGCADVVSAGEVLEHVVDLRRVIAEVCRVLRPGGLLVLDTIAATPLARLLAVTVGERLPGGPPPGIHDPALFVPVGVLVDECARHGVRLQVRGLRPRLGQLVRWLLTRQGMVDMVAGGPPWVLYQGRGVKHEQGDERHLKPRLAAGRIPARVEVVNG